MAVSLSSRATIRRLVACGNGKVYYEMPAGTMIELNTSGYAIDTTDQLIMFEGYQKTFVVNGSKLGVADFVNTKLTHNALATAHANGDVLTQTGSNATMIVDFTNTAKTATYGYVTFGTFNIDDAIIGSGTGSGFTPLVVTAKPHWYQWTVYPGGTFGTMPEKAYLGCLYRGRCVLSGNPNSPHQWYMSRQAHPWDWMFHSTDAQTAVTGGNADAGEIGDIIRTLISYKDDYLIFGCATSIWCLVGDPAEASGSINEIDLTVGMFGANSWCFDGSGNLYFWGTNGIYKMTIPGIPECISELPLPNLVNDETVDPTTHRITMVYDRTRVGILIYITKLSDGTNSNYFYDLRFGGFFPESYPINCGVYSALFYAANDSTYRTLLIGCKDGYIRKYSDSVKNDDGTLINSYVTIGPQLLGEDVDVEGEINDLSFIGADSSDEIEYKLFAEKTAEKVIEKIIASPVVPRVGGSVSIFTRAKAIRQGIRGVFAALMVGNSQNNKTWAMEQAVSKEK